MEPLRAAIFLYLFAAFIAEQSLSASVHHVTKRDTSDNDGASTNHDDNGDDGRAHDNKDDSRSHSDGTLSHSDSSGGSLNADNLEVAGDIADVREDIADMRRDMIDAGGDIGDIQSDIADIRNDLANVGGDMMDMRGDIAEARSDVADNTGSDSNSGSSDSGSDHLGHGVEGVMDIGNMDSIVGDRYVNDGIEGVVGMGIGDVEIGGSDSGTGTDSDDSKEGVRDELGLMMGITRGGDDSTDSDSGEEGTDGTGRKCTSNRCQRRKCSDGLACDQDGDKDDSSSEGDDLGDGMGIMIEGDRLPILHEIGLTGSGGTSDSDSSEGDAGYINERTSDSKERIGDDSKEIGIRVGGSGSDSSGEDSKEINGDSVLVGGYPDGIGRLENDLGMSEIVGGDIGRVNIDNPIIPPGRPSDWRNDGYMDNNIPPPGTMPGEFPGPYPGIRDSGLPGDRGQYIPGIPPTPEPTGRYPGIRDSGLPGDRGQYIPGVLPNPDPTGRYPGIRDSGLPGDRGQYIPGIPTTPEPTFVKSNLPPGMERIDLSVAPPIDPTERSYIQPPVMPSPVPPTQYPPGSPYEQNYNQGPDTMSPTQGYEPYPNDRQHVPGSMPPMQGYGPNGMGQNNPIYDGEPGKMNPIIDQTSINLGPSIDPTLPPNEYVDLSIRGRGHLVEGGPEGVAVGNYKQGPNDVKVWSDSTQPESTGIIEIFDRSGRVHGLKKICVYIREGPADAAAASTAVQTGQEPEGLKSFLRAVLRDGVVTSERVINPQGDAKMHINIPDGAINPGGVTGGMIDSPMGPPPGPRDIRGNVDSPIGGGMIDTPMGPQPGPMDIRGNVDNPIGGGMIDTPMGPQPINNQIGGGMIDPTMGPPPSMDVRGNIDNRMVPPNGAIDIGRNFENSIGGGMIDSPMGPSYMDIKVNRMPQSFINEPREILFTNDAMKRRPSRIFLAISSKLKEADHARPLDYMPGETSPDQTPGQDGNGLIKVYTKQADGSKTMKRVFVKLRQQDPMGRTIPIRRTVKIPMTRMYNTGRDGGVTIGFGGGMSPMDEARRRTGLGGSVSGAMMGIDGRLHSDFDHHHDGPGHDGHVTLPNGRFHVHRVGGENIVHDHHHGNVDRDTYTRVMELLGRRHPAVDPTFDPYVTANANQNRAAGIPIPM